MPIIGIEFKVFLNVLFDQKQRRSINVIAQICAQNIQSLFILFRHASVSSTYPCKGSIPQIHAGGIWALPVRGGGVSTLARMVWGTFLEKNLPRSNGHLLGFGGV